MPAPAPKPTPTPAAPAAHKFSYKILGRRELPGDKLGQEYVDVAWTHADGPITDTVELPAHHPVIHPLMGDPTAPQKMNTVVSGTRAQILDCVSVSKGTSDVEVHAMLEQKRKKLAESLGLEP
jgi:hypothetical protein